MDDFSPSKSDLESAETIRSFLESVRQKCRHLWAEFDLFTMTVGACLVRVLTARDYGPDPGRPGAELQIQPKTFSGIFSGHSKNLQWFSGF